MELAVASRTSTCSRKREQWVYEAIHPPWGMEFVAPVHSGQIYQKGKTTSFAPPSKPQRRVQTTLVGAQRFSNQYIWVRFQKFSLSIFLTEQAFYQLIMLKKRSK